jgi:hydrogenase expression/formation protein HypD
MEVCGTHTVAIARAGFRSVMPPNLELISGPGCPVCVTANVDIDRIIALTHIPNVVVATFGDMVRVPGSSTSLQERKAQGANVEVVYSPLDAIKLAQRLAGEANKASKVDTSREVGKSADGKSADAKTNKTDKDMQVVLVGVGFETTTPLVAATIERAAALGLENFSVLAVHKAVPPALEALANDTEVALDALILPGHVSTILGAEPYAFLAEKYHIPGVITGFEPVDVLQGVAQLLEQLLRLEGSGAPAKGSATATSPSQPPNPTNPAESTTSAKPTIEIAYKRAVMQEGNPTALAAISKVFEVNDAAWRGLGIIPNSGYVIREEFARFDATWRFAAELAELQEPTKESKGCRCGEVLRGVMAPLACPLFAKVCTPQNPIGPCMVSSEGSCAAYFRYALHEVV